MVGPFVFPAQAGMIRYGLLTKSGEEGFPRASRDDPILARGHTLGHEFSPRKQG